MSRFHSAGHFKPHPNVTNFRMSWVAMVDDVLIEVEVPRQGGYWTQLHSTPVGYHINNIYKIRRKKKISELRNIIANLL